ncbi:alpha-terpineol synthase, chloroplastic-like isoform X2 [Oryza brachyantha]|uniref:alpha-terpineol synthase, chloroplastic-like isoform X2 n=1 Tax=Oryza brachyantha TaxID=4533 RepID=UPI001ADBA592|nr:alpha-terpineol synthase, chloroplastic-like isoform X2 [Oryza brachyantha]
MATFSVQARQWCSSGHLASAASRRRCSGLSWRWPQHQRGSGQCSRARQRQLSDSGVADDRLARNPGKFHPSVWGDFFIYYTSPVDSSQQQAWMAQAEKLKEDVANIIATSVTCTLLERLQLIDALERLCVNHLFEEEINVLVMQISGINVTDCDDLHTVALWFYILRKHGYRVSQGGGRIYKLNQDSHLLEIELSNAIFG